MLELHKQLAAARTADEKTSLQRITDATDRKIDVRADREEVEKGVLS
jgi:hypothetical protein